MGIIGNLFCFYSLSTLKSFKRSSYLFYFKFLSITDSFCLFVEIIKSLNELLNYKNKNTHLFKASNFSCQFLDSLTSSFHLTSAWLICAFSIERCIAVNCPLLIRQIFNVKRTKSICVLIFFLAFCLQSIRLLLIQSKCPVISNYSNKSFEYFNIFQLTFSDQSFLSQNCLSVFRCAKIENGNTKFLLKAHFYLHQLVFLVILPSIIVISCNTVVFYRIIQRRNMLKSGKFHEFQINRVPTIRVSKFNPYEPDLNLSRISLNNPKQKGPLGHMVKDSLISGLNIANDEEYISISTTLDDSKSDSKSLNNISKIKTSRQYKKLVKKRGK